MLLEQIDEIKGRIERAGIGLKDTLSVIGMTLGDQIPGLGSASPYEAFTDLNELIDLTVHGAKVERFKARNNAQPFHTLEIHTEDGEAIGYLNMIFLKRVMPCYYLVYVEVMPPFRGLGLGARVLKVFMEFVKERKALGLLDNIIPREEVTYEIYTKLGWKNVKELIGNGLRDGWGNYMVFIPEGIQIQNLRDRMVKLLFTLDKKRPAIDMHDNEDMVKRTIKEFRSVYESLEELFKAEISSGTSNPLMRFMFTRLTTKLVGFRRRIAKLIGYTGGESLGQVSFSSRVKELQVQSYSLWSSEKDGVWGDKAILRDLPGELKKAPTFFIEALPFYKRPYLRHWMEKMQPRQEKPLRISDLLDLDLDPTRLRELRHEGSHYIFERVSPQFLASLMKKKRFLKKVEKHIPGMKFCGAMLRINLPLLIFRDRGNIYVLRKKVEGIHSQEAFDQLRTSLRLKEANRVVGIDRALLRTITEIREWLKTTFKSRYRREIEDMTYFVPWDIENNIPRLHVGESTVSLETVWIG